MPACWLLSPLLSVWPLTCLSHRQLSLRTDLPVASTRAQLEEVKTPRFLGTQHLFSGVPVSSLLPPRVCGVAGAQGSLCVKEHPEVWKQAGWPGAQRERVPCNGQPSWEDLHSFAYQSAGEKPDLGGAQRETLRCQEWGWEVSHLSDFGCCPHCPAEGGFLRRNNFIVPKRASSGVQSSIYLPWQWEEGLCLR